LGWELHVNPLDFFTHRFLTAALRTKATQFSDASSCSTHFESPPAESEEEEAEEEDEEEEEVWSDDSDDGECLPGRPLWGAHSFKACANTADSEDEEAEGEDEEEEEEEVWSDDSDDGECLPGRPLWGTHSFKTCANNTKHGQEAGEVPWSEQSFKDHKGLPSWLSWSRQSVDEEVGSVERT